MATTLDINDNRVDVDVPSDAPLLWTLRDELGMTGTKFGCGMASCGFIADPLVRPISAAIGKKITTIEAIGATPVGQRVVAA